MQTKLTTQMSHPHNLALQYVVSYEVNEGAIISLEDENRHRMQVQLPDLGTSLEKSLVIREHSTTTSTGCLHKEQY